MVNRAEELITQLEAEIVKRDALIADLEAQLEDTESSRENAARNSSAFEDRMGDLQVENGKLHARVADLEAEAAQKDERISIFESNLPAWGSLRLELAALKAQQPSGVVDERSAFEAWFADHTKDWPFPSESIKSIARSNDWLVWQARARLNTCRAQAVAVPDVYAMARVLAYRCADACNVDRDDYWKQYGDDCVEDARAMLAAAPPARQKESGDE